MKIPTYLSPSAIATFQADRVEFYLHYLADNRPPNKPQTIPMAIGASFDAFVKSYLVEHLKGRGSDLRFELRTIFEAQVEPQHREWAWIHGQYAMEAYKKSGALTDLMIELQDATEEPKFEFQIEGRIAHELYASGVPLLGKPDVYYRSKGGHRVVHDWKVNGYCSMSPTSPKKGYVICRDGWDSTRAVPSKTHRRTHKDAQVLVIDGIHINCAHMLNDIDTSWADQLSIYGWVLGEPIGGQFVACIEQLASLGSVSDPEFPLLRVSSYRNRISKEYQFTLFQHIAQIWQHIMKSIAGEIPFFEDMGLTESKDRCKSLDEYYLAYLKSGEDKDGWFKDITRSHE